MRRTCTYSVDMQQEHGQELRHAAWTWPLNMDMNMNMEHEHTLAPWTWTSSMSRTEIWTCSLYMDMEIQNVH
jgi:hypothetical protein